VIHLKIISGFQEDISKGLGLLFETFGQKLYGYSIHHWKLNEDESYDTLYKTLEIVGKVISRYEFESEDHFKNWLFKVHKNNILQLLRTKKNKDIEVTRFTYSSWENEIADLGAESFDIAEYKSVLTDLENGSNQPETLNQLMLAMQKALLQISELDRELLLLRMNEYSYDEIAKMLNIENNQLKVKFNRAKAKVERKTLEILKEANYENKQQ
jgi:RNA polymerase sigma factor (sigma-70 family)